MKVPNHGTLRSIKTDGIQIGVKKKPAGFVNWLKVDLEGNATTIEADKYDMMHRVGLHARDLRILDPLLSYPSTLLGRERAIVLNLEHIKAIITADEALIRNPTNENVLQFVMELKSQLSTSETSRTTYISNEKEFYMCSEEEKESKTLVDVIRHDHEHEYEHEQEDGHEHEHEDGHGHGDAHVLRESDLNNFAAFAEENSEEEKEADAPSPFEFQALECALDSICRFFDSKATELENSVVPALDSLITKISSVNLERVRKLKNNLHRLITRVNKVREELEQLLDDDDDMAEMFLTRKITQPGSPSNSHAFSSLPTSPALNSRVSIYLNYEDDGDVEELEQILEAYFMQVDATYNKINTLREYIDDTEDYINIQLDNHRNQLIQLELILSSATLSVALFSVIAGIFGMNIPYSWNDQTEPFGWVVSGASGITLFVFFGLIWYARYRRIIS